MSTIAGWHPGFWQADGRVTADRLTAANWESTDLLRVGPSGRLHLGIRPYRRRGGNERYIVLPSLDTPNRERYERRFEQLAEALSFANGDDGGLPAQYACCPP